MKTLFEKTARLLFVTSWLFTSIYCLLSYVPFTYRQVISINLLPWLNTLASQQPQIILGCSIVLALSLHLGKKHSFSQLVRAWIVVAMTFGIAFYDLPKSLTNSFSALIWSLCSLVPIFWLGFEDLSVVRGAPSRSENIYRLLASAFASGLILISVDFIRHPQLSFVSAGLVLAAILKIICIYSILEQILLFFLRDLRLAFVVNTLGVSGILAIFLVQQFCPAISLIAPAALVWSFGFAAAVGVSLVALASVANTSPSIAIPEGNSSLTRFLGGIFSWPLVHLIIGVGVYIYLGTIVPRFDWNGLLQQLLLVLAFIYFFAQIHLLLSRLRFSNGSRFIISIFCVLLVSLVYWQEGANQKGNGQSALADLSQKIFAHEASDPEFFQFLQRQTNLSKDLKMTLPKSDLPPVIGSTKLASKPFIFIFVIDSLRRDYLSPYNEKVDFTPAIEKFSKDALIFRNAFTRYGATGMSEPSIWAGRMFPHLFYPQPFSQINLLEKLIEAENYTAWVSRDSILHEILKPNRQFEDLDQGVQTQGLEFCRTSEEIVHRLKKGSHTGKSLFVYTQPQNIHISVLARLPSLSDGPSNQMKGFHVQYSQELKKIDSCFGQFVENLKSMNLYEKSVIILTSDHGDSLGEGGRFGHAYTVFPEVLRIPLLIHLPTDLRDMHASLDETAFLTDLAPSISFLLGRPVPRQHWSEGRSLLSTTSEPTKDKTFESPSLSESAHLVLSSYGPVAGVLSVNGKYVYISDAVNFTQYYYEIGDEGGRDLGVEDSQKNEYEKTIKQKIQELHRHFGM
ncbi:MAG TPA: sulfatase-like hydrolase/transferase [Pseudobdellovibrionaceae bacterium]|nr:sulfatase-like hydrolase/transferase [Pseudobdellovibrionaceae bacterium]